MDAGYFGWVVCLHVGARESYLCHHEYVIKPALRKDEVPQQGAHKAGTRVLFCFPFKVVTGFVCYWEPEERWREEKGGTRWRAEMLGNLEMERVRGKKKNRGKGKDVLCAEFYIRGFFVFFFFDWKQSCTVRAHSTPGWVWRGAWEEGCRRRRYMGGLASRLSRVEYLGLVSLLHIFHHFILSFFVIFLTSFALLPASPLSLPFAFSSFFSFPSLLKLPNSNSFLLCSPLISVLLCQNCLLI